MIGYPYIQQLFQTILNASKVMGGRFYVCPKWGSEMANPNIEEQLAIGQAKSQKYPAVLLMPPPKTGNFEYLGDAQSSGTNLYDIYDIRLLFVAVASVTGQNQVQKPNTIGESTHTIAETWHDMDRVAENFCSVLKAKVQTSTFVQFWDEQTPRIVPVTNLGNDNVSGVMLTFKLALYGGCTIEDYATGWETAITIPAATDIHPLHTM